MFFHSVLPKGRSSSANSAFSTLLFSQPSGGSFFLASGPANFFSSSLLVPALFFLLPLFLAQLHFLFCLSILHAPSFSISTRQILPVVFAHSVVMSTSLRHITNAILHTKHFTSLFLSYFSYIYIYIPADFIIYNNCGPQAYMKGENWPSTRKG